MKKILFVCTGNICRSPTAHAIARQKAQDLGKMDEFIFDSAAISGYHVGETPDERAILEGQNNNISFENIYSRKITEEDFDKFDIIFAMDRGHYRSLLSMAAQKKYEKVKLFLEFCKTPNPWNDEVVDPYYNGMESFRQVFKIIDEAVDNLLEM